MSRENKKIVTPGGLEVFVKSSLTGRERQVINTALLSGQEISADNFSVGELKLSGADLMKVQNEQVKQYIIKIVKGEKTIEGDPLEYLLDLPEGELNSVSDEIANLANKEEETLKD